MTEPSDLSVTLAVEYTRLMCEARRLSQRPDFILGHDVYETAILLRDAGRLLYDRAPREAIEHLDAIKKVMEIDTVSTRANLVLMRASVFLP